jgi:thiol:disulfide interchange protein
MSVLFSMRSRTVALASAALVSLLGLGAAGYKVGLPRYNAHRLAQLKGHNAYDTRIDPQVRFETALREAKALGRPLLVVLGGNWCQWCLTLDALFREEPSVRAYLEQHYVVLKLDSEQAEALNQRWGSPVETHGVPVMVFLDSEGNLVHVQPTVSLERWGGRLLAFEPSAVLATLRTHANPK